MTSRRPPRGWPAGSRRGTRSSGSPSARRVHQRVHRVVVALRPGFERTLDRRAPLIGSSCSRKHVAAVASAREHHDHHEQDAQRRAAPPRRRRGARTWAAKGTANRPGGSTRAIRNGVDVGGPPVVVLAGRPDLYPLSWHEHGHLRQRRVRVPATRRAAPPRTARALLPDARLRPGRRGRAAGRAAAGMARPRPLRGPQLHALLAVPDRDQHLPGHDLPAPEARAADRPRPPDRDRLARAVPRRVGSSPTARDARGAATKRARASNWRSSPRCSTCRPTSAPC